MEKNDVIYLTLDVKATITEFKGQAFAISGYEATEVLGKNWFEVFIPDADQEEMLRVFESFLNGNIAFWEYENELRCKDGTLRLIQWKNSLKRDSNNVPIAISSEGTLL